MEEPLPASRPDRPGSRPSTGTAPPDYEFGPFRIETATQELRRGGETIPLPPKRFEILLLLVENSGMVVMKEELLRRIWPKQIVEESNITQHIFFLRRTLEEDPRNPRYILTIPGAGYLFFAAVRVIQADGSRESIGGVEAEVAHPLPGAANGMETVAPIRPGGRAVDRRRRPSRHRLASRGLLAFFLGMVGIIFVTHRWAIRPRKAPAVITPLVTVPGLKRSVSFSPDGRFVAFTAETGPTASGQFSLFVTRAHQGDEPGPTRLADNIAPYQKIAWSPDSREIAFLGAPQRNDGKYQIRIVPVTGGVGRVIGSAFGGLDWSPDGHHLAIVDREVAGGPTAIHLLSLDGRQSRQVTLPSPVGNETDHDPRFSPDGTSIAFIRSQTSTNEEVMLINLKHGLVGRFEPAELQQLTFNRRDVRSLRWGPEGSELFFVSTQQGQSRLWRISRTGGSPSLVEGIPGEVDRFTISPDGRQLVFSRPVESSNLQIQRRPGGEASGSWWEPCVINSTQTDDTPQFSPAGDRIAFISKRSGFEEIWITDPACQRATQLTNLRQRGVKNPRWSPDGGRIAFDRSIDNQTDIFTVELIGGRIQRITDHPAQDFLPAWSSDGRAIYFASLRQYASNLPGISQIWKVPATGGTAVPVTTGGGRESWESVDGSRIFLTRGGRLFQHELATGRERQVVELAAHQVDRLWTVTRAGIVFLAPGSDLPGRFYLAHFAGKAGRVSLLSNFNAAPNRYLRGLSVSPDARQLIVSLLSPAVCELLLATDWR